MTIFPREQYGAEAKAMAHRILDEAQRGVNIPTSRITWALRITGDISGNGFVIFDSENQMVSLKAKPQNTHINETN